MGAKAVFFTNLVRWIVLRQTGIQRECVCKSAINMMLHRLQDDNCRIKLLRVRVMLKRYRS